MKYFFKGLFLCIFAIFKVGRGQKVVCYFDGWKSLDTGNMHFIEETILDAPCTHIVYAFAKLDANSNTIIYQFQPKYVSRLHQKGIKVMLAVGGYVDSHGSKYSNMASTFQNRKVFIDSVLHILDKYGFDGLEVDWEYPTCTTAPGDCGDLPEDKANFVFLINELRQALKQKLLSIAAHPFQKVVLKVFDIPSLTRVVDWFNVRTYDLHGVWDGSALHHSPLFASDQNSLEGSVNLYKGLGVPTEKIVIGSPTYGRSLKLKDPSYHEYGAPVIGKGDAGPHSKDAGYLTIMEICEKIKILGWKTGRGSEKVGPYAYGDGTFVGFDDPEMAMKKASYAKEQKLGGIMVWSLGSDDFLNVCGCGHFPVITAIHYVLVGGESVQQCYI